MRVRGIDLSAGSAISLDLGIVSAIPGTQRIQASMGNASCQLLKYFYWSAYPNRLSSWESCLLVFDIGASSNLNPGVTYLGVPAEVGVPAEAFPTSPI